MTKKICMLPLVSREKRRRQARRMIGEARQGNAPGLLAVPLRGLQAARRPVEMPEASGMFDDKRSRNGTFDMITVSVTGRLEL
jgi:hypothetical protein